jgi:hypothetical protein
VQCSDVEVGELPGKTGADRTGAKNQVGQAPPANRRLESRLGGRTQRVPRLPHLLDELSRAAEPIQADSEFPANCDVAAMGNSPPTLLLGPRHSSVGIMQAVWKEADYRDMAQHWLGFNAAELAALRQAAATGDRASLR